VKDSTEHQMGKPLSKWLIRCPEAKPELVKKPSVKPNVPSIPFPQSLIKQNKIDKDFSNFLNIFKILHINILFKDALE